MHRAPTRTISTTRSTRGHDRTGSARRVASRAVMAFAAIMVLAFGPVAGAAIAAPRLVQAGAGCAPGSGAKLAGHHFTSLAPDQNLRCADLKGAVLAGLSLGQVDLTNAQLSGADLSGTDLTQATMDGAQFVDADLTKADLTQATIQGANFTGAHMAHAKLDQATADGAVFSGADLAHVDFTQATLTGAKLDHASLTGTTFTQATLTGVDFTGAKGLLPWSTYVLGIAAIVLALMILPALRPKRLAFLARAGVRGFPTLIIGSVLVALGVHLFLGGLVGLIVGSFGAPVVQTCTAPQCVVGIKSQFVGPFAGVFAIIIGFAVKGMAPAPEPLDAGAHVLRTGTGPVDDDELMRPRSTWFWAWWLRPCSRMPNRRGLDGQAGWARLRAPVVEQVGERLAQRDLGLPAGGGGELGVVAPQHRHVDRAQQLGVGLEAHRAAGHGDELVAEVLHRDIGARAHVVGLARAPCSASIR